MAINNIMRIFNCILLYFLCISNINAQNKFDFDTTILGGREQMIYRERYIHINNYNDKYIIGSFKGSSSIQNTTIYTTSNLPTDLCRGIYMAKFNNNNEFVWLKKICESDTIVTMLSTMDRAGNILMALMYRTTLYKFNDTIQNTDHLGDIIIMKIDSAGNEIFNKSISGPCFETINSIITDDNNNVFFTGQLDQNLNNCPTDFDGVPVLNDTLVYLAKMDSNGMYLWIKKYNVGVIDRIYTYDDNIYCHGRCTLTNNDIGGIGFSYPGNYDSKCFIAKLDQSGSCVWVRGFGNFYNGALGFVTPMSINVVKNRLYFTGSGNNQIQNVFLFEGGSTLNGIGIGNESFMACYDTSGNFKWNSLLGNQNIEYISETITDSNANVIGVGNIGSNGITDAGVCSFDSSGNFLWVIAGGGNSTDVGSRIASDSYGKIFIVGGTTSSGGCYMGNDTLYPPANQSTMFFASLDSIVKQWPLGNVNINVGR
jgi:hypothetical protein